MISNHLLCKNYNLGTYFTRVFTQATLSTYLDKLARCYIGMPKECRAGRKELNHDKTSVVPSKKSIYLIV